VSFKFFKDWISSWRAYLAEFIGTFVFVFISAGSVLVNIFYGDVGIIGIAFATGMIISALMFSVSKLSGAHFNPAVTLALWLAQKIKGSLAFFYILAQISGGFAAAGVLLWIFGPDAREFSLGGPVLGVGVSTQAAVIIEALLTAILVFVYFAMTVSRNSSVSFSPIAVGAIYTISIFFAGSLTGGAINPAKALGTLVISESYSNLVIWVIGPATGSIFGIIYDFLFLRKGKK